MAAHRFAVGTFQRPLPHGKASASARQMFRRLAKAAGIPPKLARSSPHTGRHHVAVQWAAEAHSGDLAGLQRALGHTNYRSTKRYIERAEDIGATERQQEMTPNWR